MLEVLCGICVFKEEWLRKDSKINAVQRNVRLNLTFQHLASAFVILSYQVLFGLGHQLQWRAGWPLYAETHCDDSVSCWHSEETLFCWQPFWIPQGKWFVSLCPEPLLSIFIFILSSLTKISSYLRSPSFCFIICHLPPCLIPLSLEVRSLPTVTLILPAQSWSLSS